MKSVYNATDLPLKEEYDYIIVGGGTAGCPLVATLSANYSVLVEDDGKTPAQRFTSEDGVANVRGRVLGGSNMINGGFYSRADGQFYNESGIHWDMDGVEEAYQWVEDTIVFQPNLLVWQSIVREALLEARVGPNNGFSVSASGVVYSNSKGKTHEALIRDEGEVILSVGAIGSPQLLLLSGVGPVPHLSSHKVTIVSQNPDVGNFMADNPRNIINIVVPFALDSSIGQVVGITSDFNYIETTSSVTSFSFPQSFSFYPNGTGPLELSVATIEEKFSGPLSSGSLRLVSSIDVKDRPTVQFNYFKDPKDLARCVRGMRLVGDMLKTDAMERLKFEDLEGAEGFWFLGPSLPRNLSDDASTETFCRSTMMTIWHYHGGYKFTSSGTWIHIQHITRNQPSGHPHDDRPITTGVVYSDSKGRTHEVLIRDKREPKPDVGKFMVDNPRNSTTIVVPFALEPSIVQVVGITNDFNYIEPVSSVTSFSFPQPFSFDPNGTTPFELSVATIVEKSYGPLSNGSLGLVSSADVKTNTTEGSKFKDLEGAEGFKFLRPSLLRNLSNDASMEVFYQSTVTTFWHYHGGCLVGKVVDGDLRVEGTNSF
ncbi:hypothetical protein FEM48_Zijuj01G0069600 [Ziziphus jujuba var. spinosa]|uniref:(R)-mandelonitrile lyase n=1 Tax=Ziziphus jujuba var. spinosa TaxID=714518 RepID=A0A978VZS6_ZIZJJ|nr:hypothetical protein FEM48_Zijuj01G0069600 [Ziziphus jujuba var. spinosa]